MYFIVTGAYSIITYLVFSAKRFLQKLILHQPFPQNNCLERCIKPPSHGLYLHTEVFQQLLQLNDSHYVVL